MENSRETHANLHTESDMRIKTRQILNYTHHDSQLKINQYLQNQSFFSDFKI